MSGERWFDRVFELGEPISSAPEIIERLRGMPHRLSDEVTHLPGSLAVTRVGDSWSIAEHVGHLGDLEPLWLGRVEDLLEGLEDLRPADLENTATWTAGHNDRLMAELVADFAELREKLVARLEGLSESDLAASAIHPRLRKPMTVVDLAYFVAEHDEHHLAAIRTLAAGA